MNEHHAGSAVGGPRVARPLEEAEVATVPDRSIQLRSPELAH